ncbi:Short chain dehydrogenase [Mycena venus]|uniref:Short chain dehydrogenase n=1 Tax=Mycena venus TaxID=2733690 RepID=A0A8H6YCZ0_9AGAR|nr:Short chain dehydrogenase [Mycena venus]
MQFTLRLNFVALAAAIAALTVNAAPAALEARVDGRVFICTDTNFGGDCTNYGFFANQCSNLPVAFNDNISSFGPDVGWSCTMYTNPNCSGDTYNAINPGFKVLPGFLDNAFSSVRCVRV